MGTRREFLTRVAAGVGAAALRPTFAAGADKAAIKTSLNGPVGLQLWSLREYGPKDLAGTLAKARAMGFREVESAGLWDRKVEEFRGALDKAGLRCASAHMGWGRLRDDLKGALAEAKALGAGHVVCPWIDHDKTFTRDNALQAAEAFNRYGKAAKEVGLGFGYHCHGYDGAPSTEGTLFDTIAANTDAALVSFQVDTFHAFHGGIDPVILIERYASRVRSLHLKDLKKGFAVEQGRGTAPAEADVPLGTGQIDFPAVLRAAVRAGAAFYFVEDESTDPLGHIPQSVAYLEGLKLGG
jgi:sugar phosphate isomerase/epimerase